MCQKLLTCFLIFFVFSSTLSAQDSLMMRKLDSFDDPTIPYDSGVQYNDCWGYTDSNGREYAILGSTTKIHFFDITDPTDIVEVTNFTNLNTDGSLSRSLWRDFKTFGTYAYAVADENNEGLIVFDLSNLPTSVSKVYQSTALFNRAHNIFIDEDKAKIYIPGSNTQGGGLIIYDISTTPQSPVHLASPAMTRGYSHDVYVRKDTAYCFHGSTPTPAMYVYDMSNPAAPVDLGSLTTYTNSGYNHSGWLTDDSQYLIFCDESTGRKVKVASVADLSDITAPASWQFFSNLDNPGATSPNNLPHNVFVKGDSLYISYYSDGIQVYDISDPTAATRVAYYDTDPNSTSVSDGAWGVYPYYDSGTIIASDVLNGLIVTRFFDPNLPVDMGRFTAKKEDETVVLDWVTYSEVNHEHFDLQRSTNGVDFETIETIDGEGDSYKMKRYDFIDKYPQVGENYYRLEQLDKDGSVVFSEVKKVDFEGKENILIRPTLLAQGAPIYLDFLENNSANYELKVIDISGEIIYEKDKNTLNSVVEINTINWSTGVYIIELHSNGNVYSKKVVVQ